MRNCFNLAGGILLPVIAALAAGAPGQPAARLTTVVRVDSRTGKLVRTMVAVPPPGATLPRSAAPPPEITAAVNRIAAEHSLPPELVRSVIQSESNYNPYAVSPKGALGMMQLIPATARRFGVTDIFNPVDNIQGGVKYLKYLLDLYHGDDRLALAAYNAGEEAVARYGGIPPFPETRNYVVSVRKRVHVEQPATAKPAEPGGQTAGTPPGAPSHIQEIVEPDGTVRYVSR